MDTLVPVTAAHNYDDLHELIDNLEPDQVDELRQHALRLVESTPRRNFKVLRPLDGPATDLGSRARASIRADIDRDAGR